MSTESSSAVEGSAAHGTTAESTGDRDRTNHDQTNVLFDASSPPQDTRPVTPSRTAASWSLFAGIALLMIGNGLQGSLLGIRSEIEGFSTAATGAVMTCYFIGFLAGSRTATKALNSVGHIRVFAALASMASTATLVHALTVTPITWGLMRFTTGLCMAGLYVVVESWINGLATNATRGRLLALYMVVTMGGIATGQFLLNLADPKGFELFVIASVLVSLSLVPVSLSGTSAPPNRLAEPMSIRDLAKVVPTGLTVSALVGMAHGSLLGMGAVYATRAGLSPLQLAIFMGAPMVGGVALQYPIGAISDRVPRRGVMFFVAIGATLSAALLLVTPPAGIVTYLLMFAVGGFSFPLYSLGVAYTNDWIKPEQALAASSTLVTTNGLGAIMGPVMVAGLLLVLGTSTFFISLIVTHGGIAAYLAYRIVARDPLPTDRQGPFIPIPARASATAVGLLGRRRRR